MASEDLLIDKQIKRNRENGEENVIISDEEDVRTIKDRRGYIKSPTSSKQSNQSKRQTPRENIIRGIGKRIKT